MRRAEKPVPLRRPIWPNRLREFPVEGWTCPSSSNERSARVNPTLQDIHSIIQSFGPTLRLHPQEKYLLDDPDRLLAGGQCALAAGLVQTEGDYDNFTEEDISLEAVNSGESLLEAVGRARAGTHAQDPSFRYWIKIPDAVKAGQIARARAQVRVK